MRAATGEPDILLVLRPLGDPQAAHGHPARNANYRLKLVLKRLLRDYGFKCERCCDADKVLPVTAPR